MMTDQKSLTISLTVLQALCKIEVDIPERFEYASYFFHALKGDIFKTRDVNFTYELAANKTWMILDKNLNKEMLTAQESKQVINVA